MLVSLKTKERIRRRLVLEVPKWGALLGGAAALGEERAASRRLTASGRRRGGRAAASGEERRGEGERWRGREGDRGAGRKNMDGGTILMVHHPPVRHKYIHTNGAPHPGAPLVFFLISARANRLSST